MHEVKLLVGERFRVAVSPKGGVAPYSFVWNTDAVSGQTYEIPSVKLAHSGDYECTITDAVGAEYKVTVRLLVQRAPRGSKQAQ